MLEGYGRVHRARYLAFQTDPQPRILVLGHWRNPSTGRQLVGGINLNYLSDKEVEELQRVLQRILRVRSLRGRYWEGRRLMPTIFNNYYRTYDKDMVRAIRPETLKFGREKGDKK